MTSFHANRTITRSQIYSRGWLGSIICSRWTVHFIITDFINWLDCWQTLEITEGTTKNREFRETRNIGHTRLRTKSSKHNTIQTTKMMSNTDPTKNRVDPRCPWRVSTSCFFYISSAYIHDGSFSWLGTRTSVKSCWVDKIIKSKMLIGKTIQWAKIYEEPK